jgi:hypothetical protein
MPVTTNEQTRQESGNVISDGDLSTFLYLLMRDHITPGLAEKLVMDVETSSHPTSFTNGWLGHYSNYLAGRLQGKN